MAASRLVGVTLHCCKTTNKLNVTWFVTWPSAGSYLQQQEQAGCAPVPQVVQAVSGVVRVETFGPTVSRKITGLRRFK